MLAIGSEYYLLITGQDVDRQTKPGSLLATPTIIHTMRFSRCRGQREADAEKLGKTARVEHNLKSLASEKELAQIRST